jgi:PAS domain S-box-containing protein
MTAFYLPTLIFLAGLGTYASVSHAMLGLRKPLNRDHLVLAFLCLSCALYGVFQVASLATMDALLYTELLRWLQLFFGFAIVSLGVFVEFYTRVKRHWISAGSAALMIFVVIMAWGTPYTVQYDSPPILHQTLAPWGEAVTLASPGDGRWFRFVSFSVMLLNLGSIVLLARHYWRMRNATTLLILLAVGLFVLFSSQGLLVRLGLLGESIPLGPLGIATIPLAMSVALSREMRESDRRLREILDHVPALVQLKDDQGRYLLTNQYSKDFFGLGDAGILGRTDKQLLPAEVAQMFRTNDVQVLTSGSAKEFVEQIDWRGEQRTFLSIKFPLKGGDGTPVAVCSVATDITQREAVARELDEYRNHLEELVGRRTGELERKTADLQIAMDQLIQSEKLAALGSLVAGVAHELNTPIGNAYIVATSLQGVAGKLRQDLTAGALKRSELDSFLKNTEEAHELIERNIRRAGELVASFKQLAVDQTSMNRREVDLAVLVDETLRSVSPTYKKFPVEVSVDVPAGLLLDTYPGAIEQVLSNLVNNAVVHALEDGHSLRISVEAQSAVLNDLPAVFLSVSDNGKGMPEEVRKRVFDPFFTTRLGQGGSGLGLYLVHNLVTGALGGVLRLQSVPGSGSRFEMTLPLNTPDDSSS